MEVLRVGWYWKILHCDYCNRVIAITAMILHWNILLWKQGSASLYMCAIKNYNSIPFYLHKSVVVVGTNLISTMCNVWQYSSIYYNYSCDIVEIWNICDFDIAGPNMQGGDNIEILPNPTWKCHTVTFRSEKQVWGNFNLRAGQRNAVPIRN